MSMPGTKEHRFLSRIPVFTVMALLLCIFSGITITAESLFINYLGEQERKTLVEDQEQGDVTHIRFQLETAVLSSNPMALRETVLRHTNGQSTGGVSLLDNSGVILESSDFSLINTELEDKEDFLNARKYLLTQPESLYAPLNDGRILVPLLQNVSMHQSLYDYRYALITYRHIFPELQQKTNTMLWASFTAISATFIIVLLLLLWLLVTRPLKKMAMHVRLARNQDFSSLIDVQGPAEVSYLAAAINDMFRTTRETLSELQHQQMLHRVVTSALPQSCTLTTMRGEIIVSYGPENSLFRGINRHQSLIHYLPAGIGQVIRQKMIESQGTGRTIITEVNLGTSEQPRYFEFSFTPVSEPIAGEPVTLITANDISGRKQHENTLGLLASVFESREAIIITDDQARIVRTNQEFCRLTGFEEDQLKSLKTDVLASDQHPEAFWQQIWKQVLFDESWIGELTIRTRSGRIIPVRQTVSVVRSPGGQIQNFVIVFSDISEQKKAMSLIRYHANFDSLTELPNRRFFMTQLNRALSLAQKQGRIGGLLCLDLDAFKQINDSYGHPVGDKLLVEVAGLIRSTLDKKDTLARPGGDEFMILMADISGDEGRATEIALQRANHILAMLHNPVRVDNHQFMTSASMGITLFPKAGSNAFDIMREADTAMYEAKATGRNRITFFNRDMQASVRRTLNLVNQLTHAIRDEEFRVVYQPQINENRELIGFEALVRWLPSRGEAISPAEFIPLAEESGKIIELGDFVINQALKDLQRMQDRGLPPSFKRLAINISPRQFSSDDFEAKLLRAMQQHNGDPQRVELEITEGSLMDNHDTSLELLERLKDRGFSFAIDDFGTGYSSLAYLKSLPLDKLKIDQYFVRDIDLNTNDAQIVETIISMARAMNLRVIAEGVETEGQLNFLRQHACLEYQGFYFDKPLEMEAVLAKYFSPGTADRD